VASDLLCTIEKRRINNAPPLQYRYMCIRVGNPKFEWAKWRGGGRLFCNIILFENDVKSLGTRNTITDRKTRAYQKKVVLPKVVPVR